MHKTKTDGIIASVLLVSGFLFFQLAYPYHLFFREQIQLFLYTSDYFLSYFNKPAWLASYTGDFLTQFFYLIGGGAVVLSVLFVIEWWLCSIVIKKISQSDKSSLWALLPVIADWTLYCNVSHTVSFTVGFIVVLIAFTGYSAIKNTKVSLVASILTGCFGYWLTGGLSLIFPFLIILFDWGKKQNTFLKWFFLIAIIGLIPLLSRNLYLQTQPQAYLFPAGEAKEILVPIALLIALGLALLVKKHEASRSRIINVSLPSVAILLLVLGIKTNANFYLEKLFSLEYETQLGNYNRVLALSRKYDLKSRNASYFTNIALSNKNILPDSLLSFYQTPDNGLLLPISSNEKFLTVFFSSEAFFLVGDMNLAQHAAMLANTFSPYCRSSLMMKRLAEINLVNGDYAAANKYLRILEKTLFHQKWAKKIETASQKNTSLPNYLEMKQNQAPNADTLRKSNDNLASLRFLVERNKSNVTALDYLLCSQLLNKDLQSFKTTYDHYARSVQRLTPSLYSEALLVLLYSTHASATDVAAYGISTQKINDFVEYTHLFEQTHGDMAALQKKFGKTFWFYYHFATLKPSQDK